MDNCTKQYLRKTGLQLLQKIASCYRGWWQWHRICKVRGMKCTAVVLIADEDQEIAFFALAHLNRLLETRKFENAILLTMSDVVLKSAEYFSKRILAVRKIEKRQVDDLLQFACLYKFDERFICASIDLPVGRNGHRLVGKRNISKEEVFAVGVYGLYPFEQAHVPNYTGEDSDVVEFMKGKSKNDS